MEIEKMKQLANQLYEANRVYEEENRELISNLEYDKLYDELSLMEEKTGVVLSNSVTRKVGHEILTNLTKIPHDSPMLSLDKTKEIGKLQSFLGNHTGLLSWKLDGLTIVLTYENGELQQAITRGNGQIGEDITHNARQFKNLPLHIPYQGKLVLRGEGVISNTQFEKINESLDGDQKYKNPRNLCSGTVRQLNSEIVAKRGVLLLVFALVSMDDTLPDSKADGLQFIKNQGFEIVDYEMVTADNLTKTLEQFKENIQHTDIGSDGLVMTFDSRLYSETLGTTSKFPKDAIAFKWADEMVETKLLEVEWNTSRTGLMNPIAIFEPVDIEGTEVSRASLHNVSILQGLKLGLGDTIVVYKANMIIPQVAENKTESDTLEIPKHCFVCGGVTSVEKVRDGEVLYCTNPLCEAKIIQKFSHFVSRNALNMEGISEETLRKFLEKGFLKEFTDLFSLENHSEAIQTMDGFGKRSYENIIASIEKGKDVALPNFIYALGIDQVGLSNAKLLCKDFQYSMEQIMEATAEQLEKIDGFGEIIANNITSYFAVEKNRELVNTLISSLRIALPTAIAEGDLPLENLTFVVTGDVEQFKNRKELSEKIESLGGKVVGSVSKKTDFLINNDAFSESSKNKKAKSLNIPIVTEQEFIDRFLMK
ncbi:MAG: NAD-dependent DNA ligase LigA [Bacillota bacterium]